VLAVLEIVWFLQTVFKGFKKGMNIPATLLVLKSDLSTEQVETLLFVLYFSCLFC